MTKGAISNNTQDAKGYFNKTLSTNYAYGHFYGNLARYPRIVPTIFSYIKLLTDQGYSHATEKLYSILCQPTTERGTEKLIFDIFIFMEGITDKYDQSKFKTLVKRLEVIDLD